MWINTEPGVKLVFGDCMSWGLHATENRLERVIRCTMYNHDGKKHLVGQQCLYSIEHIYFSRQHGIL
jgi:hypothetical protein